MTMMRHQEHHLPPNQLQRDPNRMGLHRMPPPQTRGQPMMVGLQPSPVPVTGVLVSMPAGPALITTAPAPQQAVIKPLSPVAAAEAEIPNPQSPLQTTQNSNNTSLPANLANTKEKTPMCLINELARYNKIQHQYRLTSEQGPAHKKRFTVTLKLGTEEYEAEGASIKKAQHSAAAEALAKTQFKHPPQKSTRNVRNTGKHGGTGILTPTVELNALAMKRGERTMYLLETVPPNPFMTQPGNTYGYHRNNIYGPQGQPRYNYDARRNHTARGGHYMGHYAYNQYKPHNYTHQPPHGHGHHGEMFNVILRVGSREYTGEGHTVQAARHNAASKALHELKQLPAPGEADVSNAINANVDSSSDNNVENGMPDLNTELKSPISLVHEIALKRNLNVIFEVLSEKGPPHMKVFVTVCRVGDLVAEGEGNGKKISKKRAAEKMLEELSKLPPLPYMNDIAPRLKRKRVVTKKKIRNLIKVNQEKPGSEYGEDINPISRLIQIQQAGKEKEPTYTVIEERGAPRRREFVIEASVNGISCTGTGPNKKLAKRAAAESLLERLGYSKSASQPTKPSIKIDKETATNETQDKPRKVKFMEDKSEVPVGGSGGRQLVPGVLLMGDQSTNYQVQGKMNINMQQTAAIAKEFLKGGTSPTADALANKQGTKAPQTANNKQPAPQGIRSKDQLLYLAQLLGVQVQFSDFPKANHEMYLTLVSLSTTPPQVCHGEGPTTEASHEKAALEALTVLSELGLDNVIPKKEQSPTDGVHVSKNPVMIKSGMISNGIKK